MTVRDLFEPDAPEVEIRLDPLLSPEKNIESYFKRYKKLKASRQHVESRLAEAQKESQILEGLAREVEATEDAAAVETLVKQAEQAGLTLPRKHLTVAEKAAPAGPRRFTSAGGFEILVARNREENQELTFSIARGSDYWMHLLGWEGPHVIIRKPKDKDVPLETLLDAAHLAIHFSKIRGTDYAEVIYTQRKHVRPVKDAGPGRVSYANVSRLAVRFEQERLKRLMQGKAALKKSPGQILNGSQ